MDHWEDLTEHRWSSLIPAVFEDFEESGSLRAAAVKSTADKVRTAIEAGSAAQGTVQSRCDTVPPARSRDTRPSASGS